MITKNLTITGGATLDGGHTGSVLTIEPGVTVTISSFTITGGAGFVGGGICSNGGSVTLTGSTISGNTAGTGGGGIENVEGTATLNAGSHIRGNTPDNCAQSGSVPGCSG